MKKFLFFLFLIICIGAGGAYHYYTTLPKVPKDVLAREMVNNTMNFALYLFELDNGQYPTTEQGLAALLARPTIPPFAPNWNGPYLENRWFFIDPLKDPWYRPYRYACPGTHHPELYDLSSLGPDGVTSNDDITNW
jgi:general secretion pathway protein G